MSDRIVTIIGSWYFEPIAQLYAEMENSCSDHATAIRANARENGYAASICLLTVACLESYAMRAWYLHNPDARDASGQQVVKFLPALYDDFPYSEELKELYVLRDSLMHNHIWEIEYDAPQNGAATIQSIDKKSTGDVKYKNAVDPELRKTKRLHLNVNPIRVGRWDATRAIVAVWSILEFLEGKDHNQCGVSHLHVKYKGDSHALASLIRRGGCLSRKRVACGRNYRSEAPDSPS